MEQKCGLLVDNYWCTGCHSSEVSCKNEHDLPIGQFGIKMLVAGTWEHTYYLMFASYCDLCADCVVADAASAQHAPRIACPL